MKAEPRYGTASPHVAGQVRSRPLAATLAAAREAAAAAGITRLGDISQLDPLGLPAFQAVRPRSRGLSVALGKGLTPRAAMVSALMEGIEIDVAERVAADGPPRRLADMGAAATALWCSAPRDPLAIRLDPDLPRGWLPGTVLGTGAACALPLDLVSLDYTVASGHDALRTSVGLASGNSPQEALAGAVAELIEHDLTTGWRAASPPAQRRCELNLASIDAPLVRALLARIGAAGRRVRLWSVGQEAGIAAFECVVSDAPGSDTDLPPVRGSACHPCRETAALGAILEAAQGRAAMIAGTREDLTRDAYREGRARTLELVFATLGFGPGELAWGAVPTHDEAPVEEHLALLQTATERLSPLPIVTVALAQPHPALHVARALAPGLRQAERRRLGAATPAACWTDRPLRASRTPRRILFAGPSLAGAQIPSHIMLRPPAVAGDLAALLDDPPEMIGLVDGCFEIAPSVWHKELLDLIAHGVATFGAASLGALRAAELGGFGMIGVGSVFEAYRTGTIHRDDAVMVTHAPAALGSRPLTVALVDAEATLAAAALPPADRRMLQRIARTMPFRQRTWAAIVAEFARRCGRPLPLNAAALAAMPSRKQADALELVARMSRPPAAPPPAARPPLTHFYRALLETV